MFLRLTDTDTASNTIWIFSYHKQTIALNEQELNNKHGKAACYKGEIEKYLPKYGHILICNLHSHSHLHPMPKKTTNKADPFISNMRCA